MAFYSINPKKSAAYVLEKVHLSVLKLHSGFN